MIIGMKSYQRVPEKTADGTYTLYIPEIDEHYHSVNGAAVEARHVYLTEALKHHGGKSVSVLEVGFGTGLNAFLTLLESIREGITIHYTTLELYPLDAEQVRLLNYGAQLAPEYAQLYFALHDAPWNEPVEITEGFILEKRNCDLLTCELEGDYDVVYFDAFAPEKQGEMWSEKIYGRIFERMTPGGVMTTYCAKGVVRRGFQAVGFTVERIPGPPGKREMLRAVKAISETNR